MIFILYMYYIMSHYILSVCNNSFYSFCWFFFLSFRIYIWLLSKVTCIVFYAYILWVSQAFPGNWTHDLVVTCAMLFCLSYRSYDRLHDIYSVKHWIKVNRHICRLYDIHLIYTPKQTYVLILENKERSMIISRRKSLNIYNAHPTDNVV